MQRRMPTLGTRGRKTPFRMFAEQIPISSATVLPLAIAQPGNGAAFQNCIKMRRGPVMGNRRHLNM